MNKAIIGRKVGMTQIFAEDGKMSPVTVVEAGPCPVVQVKKVATDGYAALKLGFIELDEKRAEKILRKPDLGQFKRANVKPHRVLKEVRVDNAETYEPGAVLTAEIFAAGERVDVSGVTKGHGFTGVIKKWNQHRLKMTHGTGPVHREPGSMGPISSPSRVFKNKHLAGQYGCDNVTIQNLEIVRVDANRNVLLIKGAIPGPKGSIVTVKNSVKSK